MGQTNSIAITKNAIKGNRYQKITKYFQAYRLKFHRCFSTRYECADGGCAKWDAKCDGHAQCEDGSDESDCGGNYLPILPLATPSSPW